jgi:hypothetical protein
MPRTTPASVGAKKAIAKAARKYAPGYFKAGSIRAGKKSGRWIRKGNKIILLGV